MEEKWFYDEIVCLSFESSGVIFESSWFYYDEGWLGFDSGWFYYENGENVGGSDFEKS